MCGSRGEVTEWVHFCSWVSVPSPPSQAEYEVGANESVSVLQAEDALLVGGTLCELKKGAAQTDHLSMQDFWEALGKTGFPS